MVVNRKIGTKTTPDKRVKVLKDDLNAVLCSFHQQFLFDEDEMVLIPYFPRLQALPINHYELNAASIVIDWKVLLVHIGQSLQPE